MSFSASEGTRPNETEGPPKFVPEIVCGLRNLGNTCYFNSGMQILANVGAFVTSLTHSTPFVSAEADERHCRLHPTHTTSGRRLMLSASATLQDMITDESLQFAPRDLLTRFSDLNTSFQGMHQQDCPEMLTMLLGQLEDETKVDLHRQPLVSELLYAGSGTPVNSGSRRFLAMLQLLLAVDKDNAEAEMRERRAKKKAASPSALGSTTTGSSSLDSELYSLSEDMYRPPHMTRNAVNDCFRGQMLHEIMCTECKHVSRTADEFTSLTVELPTTKQRHAHQKRFPDVPRYDAAGVLLNPSAASQSHPPTHHDPVQPHSQVAHKKEASYRWWNPLRYVTALFSAISSCLFGRDPVGHSLTLEECLDIHFHEETLSGSNRYFCTECLRHTNAIKKHSVLWYPEYLMVHMKRFEVGSYWTSKRKEPVIFPMGSSDSKSTLRRPLELGNFGSEALKHAPGASAYRLTGVVNHHGGYGGGHYTSYVHKGALGWVLCDDERVTRVSEDVVAESEEYLLVYEKLPLPQEAASSERFVSAARDTLLAEASRIQSGVNPNASKYVMVSRAWLHRVATFQEPGPLMNRRCYCRVPPTEPHAHGSVVGTMVPVLKSEYDALVEHFGGPQMPFTVADYLNAVTEEDRIRR